MKRLLAATDLSSRSDRAVRRAAELASAFNAELILLHVVKDDRPLRLQEAARREATTLLLEQVAGLPELRELNPQVVVLTGQPSDSLLRATESEAADLIAMGASRRELLRYIFTGTTVERVIRNASRPVLMVNGLPTGPYRRLLAATDLDDPSAQALRVASALGLLAGADLTVLHAFWQPGKVAPILAGTSEEDMADRRESLAMDAQADLHRFLGAVGLPSAPPPRAIVREGAPEMVIREEVGRLRPDLVLMGTGQRGKLSAMLLGSVAEAVLSVVECDVLVVPPGNSGERTSGASPMAQPGAAPTGGDDDP